MKRLTHAAWTAEGQSLFGPDSSEWKLICPVCKHVAKVKDWQDVKAPKGAVGFSCIGRYLPTCRDAFGGKGPRPCNYTNGGLFRLGPVIVEFNGTEQLVFEFAPVPKPSRKGGAA